MIPAEQRGPIAAVYAFARVADDFADEPGWTPPERLSLLDDWRRRLRACGSSHNRHPVFWAVADAVERFRLPLDPFERLITAFERDVTKNRHENFDEVLDYCRYSANPVGELVLRVFGFWNEERGKWSDAVCTGLQLANFWQDVTVDAAKDRIYVPREDMKAHGLAEEQILRGPVIEPLRRLIAFQVERTWTFFRAGVPLCDDVPNPLRRELRLVWLGGTRILEKIGAQDGDVWGQRPTLGKTDLPRLMQRLFFWNPAAVLPRGS